MSIEPHDVAITVRWCPSDGCYVATADEMDPVGAPTQAEAISIMDERVRIQEPRRLKKAPRSTPEEIKAADLKRRAELTNAFAAELFPVMHRLLFLYRRILRKTLLGDRVDRFSPGKKAIERRLSVLTNDELLFIEAVRVHGLDGISEVAEKGLYRDLSKVMHMLLDMERRGFVRQSPKKKTIHPYDENFKGNKRAIVVRPVYLTPKALNGLARIDEIRRNLAATLLENCTPSLRARGDIVGVFRRFDLMLSRDVMGPGLRESRVDRLLREISDHPEWTPEEIDAKFEELPGRALEEDYEHLFEKRGHPLSLMST